MEKNKENIDKKCHIDIDQITNTMRKAYWDKFKEELEGKDYERMYSLMNEAKEKIKSFIPSRKDIALELDEKIDTKWFKQMIDHDVFEPMHLFNLGHYFIDLVDRLASPSDDEDNKLWKESFDKIATNTCDQIDYPNIIPPFFETLMDRLDRIERDLIIFSKMLEEESNST